MGEKAQLKNINAALSDSINKQYSRAWRKYTDYCKKAKVDNLHLMIVIRS